MILILAQAYPPSSGGIQTLMEGLADQIGRRGHAVCVLADGGSAARAYDADRPGGPRVMRFDGPRPWRRWRKRRAMARVVAGGRVRAIFADSWKSLEVLSVRPGIPTAVYAHGNEYPTDGRKHARIRAALGRADRLIAVSADTRARAAAFLPPDLAVSVIHPPLHPLAPVAAGDAAFAAAAWAGAPVRLLALARLTPLKGIDQAIRALPAIRDTAGGAVLVVAGEGEDQGRLAALARELGVADAVRFVGRVEGGRKAALLGSATLFLQPGRRVGNQCEGFGITYLEAALAGVPQISGRDGGAPEAIRPGETGLVVDGTDTAAIVAAARAILGDPARHAAMAAASRRHGAAALWSRRIDDILAAVGLCPAAATPSTLPQEV